MGGGDLVGEMMWVAEILWRRSCGGDELTCHMACQLFRHEGLFSRLPPDESGSGENSFAAVPVPRIAQDLLSKLRSGRLSNPVKAALRVR